MVYLLLCSVCHPLKARGVEEFELAPDETYWTQGPVAERIEKSSVAGAPPTHRARSTSGRGESRDVYYEVGKTRNEFTRRILSDVFVVTFKPSANVDAIAEALNADNLGQVNIPGEIYRFRLRNYEDIDNLESRVDEFLEILAIDRQFARMQERRILGDDPLLPDQWHLNDPDEGIYDINLGNLWDRYTGAGVVIGIVDDGLPIDHPDLLPNLESSLHYDFRDGDNDPSPNLLTPDEDDGASSGEDKHGAAVAGLAAARGGNGIGVSGVAPEAHIAGIRLIGDYAEDVTEAEAFLHGLQTIDIKNNSWGPAGFGDIITEPGPLAKAALKQACEEGRGGKGTIFVWAAGNGGLRNDDSNRDGFNASPYTISVGAVNEFGEAAYYSEPGACLTVCAPSYDRSTRGLITTDLQGDDGYNHSALPDELDDLDYTNSFSGTSGAAPIVSGVVALMLEANPNLNWRDVQEILLRTAQQVDVDDDGWFTNAADTPFQFNRRYGAGLIDAQAAVDLAESWTSLGERKSIAAVDDSIVLPVDVPDDGTALELDFTIPNVDFRVEHATMRLTIFHTRRGDISVELISPSGTSSLLLHTTDLDEEDHIFDFTLGSLHFWGEDAAGKWTLRILDNQDGESGEVAQATLMLYGTSNDDLPAAPDNLFMTRTSYISAWLSWDDLADSETGYRIERSAYGESDWRLVATTAPNVTYYYDETLDDAYYYYRVCAVKGSQRSAYTEPYGSYRAFLEDTVLYFANFEADQGYATGAINGQNGWWTDSSSGIKVISSTQLNGSRLLRIGGTGYQGTDFDAAYGSGIYFEDPNANALISFKLRLNSTAAQAKDAFGFEFFNLNGERLFGFEVYMPTRQIYYYNEDLILKPLNRTFSLNTTYNMEVEIDFTKGYWSLRRDGTALGNRLPVSINNKTNGLAYHECYWYISSVNSPGSNQMLIDNFKISMIATQTPDAPLNLEAHAQGASTIFLYWDDPFLASKYYIEGRPVGSSTWQSMLNFPVEDWPLPVAVKGLEPDTEYEFRIRAENEYGFSSYSSTVTMSSLHLYQDWLLQMDLDAEESLLNDPFEVGHPLLLAYALGIHPEYITETRLPKPSVNDDTGMLELKYYRGRDDVSYQVVASDNLVGPWLEADVVQEFEVDGRYVTAAIEQPVTGARFLRLVCTLDEE
ncbi:S8 family serine peptidase [Cerasicoccus frondis]|uniref:S8 family serine peptidase n=1 Tax=Cerasicoccus frondis TaxID=490090 RepID=UPI0028526364|nr:S8 family serine peptidase [Cerasicoccus frondis]